MIPRLHPGDGLYCSEGNIFLVISVLLNDKGRNYVTLVGRRGNKPFDICTVDQNSFYDHPNSDWRVCRSIPTIPAAHGLTHE